MFVNVLTRDVSTETRQRQQLVLPVRQVHQSLVRLVPLGQLERLLVEQQLLRLHRLRLVVPEHLRQPVTEQLEFLPTLGRLSRRHSWHRRSSGRKMSNHHRSFRTMSNRSGNCYSCSGNSFGLADSMMIDGSMRSAGSRQADNKPAGNIGGDDRVVGGHRRSRRAWQRPYRIRRSE